MSDGESKYLVNIYEDTSIILPGVNVDISHFFCTVRERGLRVSLCPSQRHYIHNM